MAETTRQQTSSVRKLAAIRFTDIVGYTTMMGESRAKLTTINLVFIFLTAFTVKAQTSLKFDGIDDLVDCGNSSLFMITGDLTIEAWIKQDSTQYWPTYGGNYDTTGGFDSGYWLGGDNLGHATFYIAETSTTSGYFVFSSSVIADGNWHHIAGVFDSDIMKIYVDGVLENVAIAPNYNLASTGNLLIGNDVLDEKFKGNIDEFRLWNIARTPEQLLKSKDSCLTGNENNLVLYYQFESGQNSSNVIDLTENGNNGHLINMDTVNSWSTNCTECDTRPADCSTITNIRIDKNNFEIPLVVYPNPTKGVVTVDLGKRYNQINARLFNSIGELISTNKFSSTDTFDIELDNGYGYYIILVTTTGGKSVTIKVLKQ